MKKKVLSMVLASGLALTGVFGSVPSVYADTNEKQVKDVREQLPVDYRVNVGKFGSNPKEKIYYDTDDKMVHIIIKDDYGRSFNILDENRRPLKSYTKDYDGEYKEVMFELQGDVKTYKLFVWNYDIANDWLKVLIDIDITPNV